MLRTLCLTLSLAVAAATNEFGTNFLAENKGKDGVITLASGLQYKVLRAGDGKNHPTVNSPCEVCSLHSNVRMRAKPRGRTRYEGVRTHPAFAASPEQRHLFFSMPHHVPPPTD